MSDGLKGIKYAEEQLGVHQTHSAALIARENLMAALERLSTLRDKKRALENQLTEQEMVIASDEWGKHHDMSAARMETHLKIAKSKDPILQQLREDLRTINFDIESAENVRVISEADIKIAVGRLHELGGYLEYLAAIKNASEANSA
jgi:hypothetical protein